MNVQVLFQPAAALQCILQDCLALLLTLSRIISPLYDPDIPVATTIEWNKSSNRNVFLMLLLFMRRWKPKQTIACAHREPRRAVISTEFTLLLGLFLSCVTLLYYWYHSRGFVFFFSSCDLFLTINSELLPAKL